MPCSLRQHVCMLSCHQCPEVSWKYLTESIITQMSGCLSSVLFSSTSGLGYVYFHVRSDVTGSLSNVYTSLPASIYANLCKANYSRNPMPGMRVRNSKLLATTLMLLSAIARAAHAGSSRTRDPPLVWIGYNTPAATGKAIML